MDKKLIITIIVVIVAFVVLLGVYFAFSPKDETQNNSNLNLAQISNDITEKGFEQMAATDIDKEILSSYYQVNIDNVEEVYGKMPLMNVHASMYILIKSTSGNSEQVKQDLENFGTSYEQQWAMYLPEQYEIVKNRKIGTIGDYVYMIIAENTEELVNLIK